MTQVLVASMATGENSSHDMSWPMVNGPIHLALAHYYLSRAIRDFVIIGRGPVAGYPVVGAQVATLTAVSPQSGGLAEAKIEGTLASMLLRLGLDVLVLLGAAPEVSGVRVSGGSGAQGAIIERPRVRVDEGVWATDTRVRESSDDVVLTTGSLGMASHPAASIVVNSGFPTTQGGLGAVFGQMNLKYVVLASAQAPALPTATQARITDAYAQAIDGNPLTKSEKDYPGFALWPSRDLVGYAGSQRFAGSVGPGMSGFSPDGFMDFALDDGRSACPGCPQSCLKSFGAGSEMPINGGRAHQLAISAFASQGDETDVETLVSFNALCHDLGVEHLVAEESLAAAGYERGENFAQSILRALDQFPGCSGRDVRVKGMAIPPFDPRANQGLGVGYALNPTGPRYDVLEHDIDFTGEHPWMTREGLERDFGIPPGGLAMGTLSEARHRSLEMLWLAWSGLDALGICEYAAPPTRELTVASIAELVRDVTGESFTDSDIYDQGLIRLAILRQCNALLGLGRGEDVLPEWCYESPIAEGPLAGSVVDRDEFHAAADFLRSSLGWAPEGLSPNHSVRARVDTLARDLDVMMEEAIA
jgi:aldehyde:ferredoxin oxidoreductase